MRRAAINVMIKLVLAMSAAGLMGAVTACAPVKPYQKEHFADPLLNDPRDDQLAMHEMKWLDAREGSTGGVGGAGGGCACK